MMDFQVIIVTLLVVSCHYQAAEGRGRLVEPPARSSMWRFGFKTPINYNDNGLNCGGIVRQWSYNQGQCGVCGDVYDGARDNERGGRYVTDIVARTYTQGQVISVTVDITANERGWFQFNLCPDSDPKTPVTKKCLQQHILKLANGNTSVYLDPTVMGTVKLQVRLPPGVTCDRCVFRWKWNAGNAWGMDADGKTCLGCGIQEQFYGCADVAIRAQGQSPVVPLPTSRPTVRVAPTMQIPITTDAPVSITDSSLTFHTSPSTMKVTKAKSSTPPSTMRPKQEATTVKSKPTTQMPASKIRCKAINDWLGILVFDQWCEINCNDLNICLSKNCLCNMSN